MSNKHRYVYLVFDNTDTIDVQLSEGECYAHSVEMVSYSISGVTGNTNYFTLEFENNKDINFPHLSNDYSLLNRVPLMVEASKSDVFVSFSPPTNIISKPAVQSSPINLSKFKARILDKRNNATFASAIVCLKFLNH